MQNLNELFSGRAKKRRKTTKDKEKEKEEPGTYGLSQLDYIHILTVIMQLLLGKQYNITVITVERTFPMASEHAAPFVLTLIFVLNVSLLV